MCQDEDENEDRNQSFCSFWNFCMTNEPILQCIIVLRAWFVRHRLYPERTKTFVFRFVFVFVLVHEQPMNSRHDPIIKIELRHKILLPPFHEKTCTPKNPAISRVITKERKKCYKTKNVVLSIISKFYFINLP